MTKLGTAIENLHNRIDLVNIPFTDRGSRLLVFREGDVLYFRLAERWAKWETEMGHYRQRPPILQRFTITSPDGTPYALRAETYPHLVQLLTPGGQFDLTFVDTETILMRLPQGRYGFEFKALAESGQSDRRGGTFRGKRNIAYTTNAHLLKNETVQEAEGHFRVQIALDAKQDDVFLLNVTPRLGYNRAIHPPQTVISESLGRWQAWFDSTPPVLDIYRKQYDYAWWIMRSGLLNTRYFFTREALVPSKVHYVGVWQWDQYFHALAYRHINPDLAEDQIRIVLDHQRSDGMLPDAIHDEGLITHLAKPVDADVTKPPLITWAALKLYETTKRLDFLAEIYQPITRWHEWWIKYNMNANGLCEYRHPFSSGQDDSPLWDSGMPVVTPDLNTYLCIQSEGLARIAEMIGETEDVARYKQEADHWARLMVEILWDEKQGLFNSLYSDRPIPTLTPISLLPLWTGRLSEAMCERLLSHLVDPATFWPKWPLPTVAISDPKFDPQEMWRGPTWANMNYLFIEALERIGKLDLAGQLRRKTLDMLMQYPDIYEYYNPLTGTHPPKAAAIFGWSAAVFIDLAIQESQRS